VSHFLSHKSARRFSGATQLDRETTLYLVTFVEVRGAFAPPGDSSEFNLYLPQDLQPFVAVVIKR
jgi:hypothetical protein